MAEVKRSAGRGTIRKRTGGRPGFEGRLRYVDALGAPKRLEVYGATVSAVEVKLDRAREALLEGRSPKDAALVTFDAYATAWVEGPLALSVVDRATSEATARIRREAVRLHLIPLLGATRLVALTPSSIKTLSLKLATEPRVPAGAVDDQGRPLRYAGRLRSSSTRRQVIITLRAVLDQAVDDGILSRSPATSVPVPTQVRLSPVPQVASSEQILGLLTALEGDRLAALFQFLARTGARIGDARSLRWSDVDLDGSVYGRPTAAVIGKGRRGGKPRTFPLSPVLVEALKAHRAAQLRERMGALAWADPDVVFARRAGQPFTATHLSEYVTRATEAAGCRLTPHQWRHAFITHVGRVGAPLADLAASVGHVNPNITLGIYTHGTTEGMDTLAELIDVAFPAAVI